MPVEQVRNRKTPNREPTVQNRRTNALKHQHGGSGGSGGGGNTHPGSQIHPSVLKNSGHVNGVNVIGLTGSSASSSNQPMSTSMSSKIANISGAGGHTQNPSGLYCFFLCASLFHSNYVFLLLEFSSPNSIKKILSMDQAQKWAQSHNLYTWFSVTVTNSKWMQNGREF